MPTAAVAFQMDRPSLYKPESPAGGPQMLERGAGNDPATSCLASKRSPTELPPRAHDLNVKAGERPAVDAAAFERGAAAAAARGAVLFDLCVMRRA